MTSNRCRVRCAASAARHRAIVRAELSAGTITDTSGGTGSDSSVISAGNTRLSYGKCETSSTCSEYRLQLPRRHLDRKVAEYASPAGRSHRAAFVGPFEKAPDR